VVRDGAFDDRLKGDQPHPSVIFVNVWWVVEVNGILSPERQRGPGP
jgi:hypothetical protein